MHLGCFPPLKPRGKSGGGGEGQERVEHSSQWEAGRQSALSHAQCSGGACEPPVGWSPAASPACRRTFLRDRRGLLPPWPWRAAAGKQAGEAGSGCPTLSGLPTAGSGSRAPFLSRVGASFGSFAEGTCNAEPGRQEAWGEADWSREAPSSASGSRRLPDPAPPSRRGGFVAESAKW